MQHAATALLERDGELAALGDAVARAAGGRGSVLLVEGPAGIGKTRLLEAARERAERAGMTTAAARPSELDREFPFGVVRQLFEPIVAGADAPARARLLHGAAAPAAALLGGEAPARASDGDPSWAHFHALYWLVANLAELAPLALFVDDLHWADASSLRFLQFLAPRLPELPVLVAAATRPRERAEVDALAADPAALALRPAPLTDRAVAELVAAELGAPGENGFCGACREATGGNPFLLRELLRELAADDVAPTSGHEALVRQLAPPTVARAVLLRLARLGDDAARLAGAVAVLGDGAPLRRAAALGDLDDERAGEAAGALARADILAAQRPLAFAHPILRAAVYADLDGAARARAHRRAAALLAAEGAAVEAVAPHLLASEPTADASVAVILREAASRALARGAAPTAVACLRRALAEPPPAGQRAAVTLELARAELVAGDPAGSAAHYEQGLRLAGDVRTRLRCVKSQVLVLQALGRHAESLALLEQVVDEAADVDPERALAIEAELIASATLERSRRAWALGRLERYRDRMSPDTPGGRKLLATRAALDAFAPGCRTPAAELADAAEAALGGLLDEGQSTPFFFAVMVLALADRTEPALGALDRSLEYAGRRGSAPDFAFGAAWRSWLLAREGRLEEAEADARSSAELALSQGWVVMGPVILGYQLDVLVERGELDDAEALLERSGMAARDAEHDASFDDVVAARARLRAARNDLDAARADFARLERRRGRWNTYPTLVPGALVAPALAGDGAREHAERMLDEARAWGTPRAVGIALRGLGLLEGGARGIELLGDAVAVLESSPARLEHARALVDLGAALRRANRRADARGPLRRALDAADACGATPLAERARAELLAAGGRPRRPRLWGVEALTASERRIAAMAADGLSNPEIAQALFVTTKTVEAHLSSAYRKLNIRSRAQLASALG